jgi:hypothetical protein
LVTAHNHKLIQFVSVNHCSLNILMCIQLIIASLFFAATMGIG